VVTMATPAPQMDEANPSPRMRLGFLASMRELFHYSVPPNLPRAHAVGTISPPPVSSGQTLDLDL